MNVERNPCEFVVDGQSNPVITGIGRVLGKVHGNAITMITQKTTQTKRMYKRLQTSAQ